MPLIKRNSWFVPASIGIGLGIVIDSVGLKPSLARPAVFQQAAIANLQERTLHSTTMQTSSNPKP